MELPRTHSVELRAIRNVPEILNATFDFIRQHFRPLSRLILQRAFPPLALGYILLANVFSTVLMEGLSSSFYNRADPSGIALQVLLLLVLFAVGYTLMITTVHVYVLQVLESESGEVSFDEAWRDTKAEFWRVFWTNVGVGLLYALASIIVTLFSTFFSIFTPLLVSLVQTFGILAIVTTYAVYYPARLIEGTGFGYAFTRSSSLVAGSWWKTMGLILLCGLLIYSMVLVALVPFYIVVWLVKENIATVGWLDENRDLIRIVSTASIALFASLLQLFSIFPLVSLILHYFNLVERLESASLEERLEEIGVADAEG
ncbi:MAG: hypothetical protein AB7H80_09845 [Candidatus Kapaibacterium sp.]